MTNPILTWYEVNLGVMVAGIRVPVNTSMLALHSEEVHDRCKRVAEGMGGVVSDVRVQVKNPVGASAPSVPASSAAISGYLPPPCTYKAEPRPDPIVLEGDGWIPYHDTFPGVGAILGVRNDKAAT